MQGKISHLQNELASERAKPERVCKPEREDRKAQELYDVKCEYERVQAEVVLLQKEVASLRRENGDLVRQVGDKGLVQRALSEKDSELEVVKRENRKLMRQLEEKDGEQECISCAIKEERIN